MLADDLVQAQIAPSFLGSVHAAGLAGGFAYHEFSDDAGATKGQFADGATARLISPDSVDSERPALTELEDGSLLVALTQGGVVRLYVSPDQWTWNPAGSVE